MYDANKTDTCNVTIIATGIEEKANQAKGLGFKSTYITPTSLQGKTSVGTGAGLGSFSAGNMGIRPSATAATTATNAQAGGAAPTPVKTITGINKATDIRSSVEEKSLKIPDFLQRK